MTATAAHIYALMCAGVVLFQLALIFGAPWGRITQGGNHEGALPMRGRVFAAVSLVLMVLMGTAMLSAAGALDLWPRWMGWAALGITAISCVLNWITPSRPERLLWGPTLLVMLLLAGFVMTTSGG